MTDTTLSRRGFLGTLIGGLAAGAAVRTWPFRVFSFPTEIKPWEWRFAMSWDRFPMESIADQHVRGRNGNIYFGPKSQLMFWPSGTSLTRDAPVHLGRVREMQIAQIDADLHELWKNFIVGDPGKIIL